VGRGLKKGVQCTISNVNKHYFSKYPEILNQYQNKTSASVVDINYCVMEWIARCNHSFSIVVQDELLCLSQSMHHEPGYKILKYKQLVNQHLHHVYNPLKLRFNCINQ